MKHIGTGDLLASKTMMFSLIASLTTGQNTMKSTRRDRQEDVFSITALQNICLNSGELHHEKRYPVFRSPVDLILFFRRVQCR